MKRFEISSIRRFLKDEGAQAAVMAVVTASTMMALAGASLETGHIYYAYQQLQASTNAAVVAGAMNMPNTTTAATNVTLYSAESGQLNANPMLQNASATPTFLCLGTVTSTLNVPCSTATGAAGGYNALSVTQTAQVKLWFGGLVGVNQMNLLAKATAAMAGGTNEPWNIAVILDTTASMNDSDGGTQCSSTRITCARQGLQILLEDLYPCSMGQTCTGTSINPVDTVTLFVFPAMTNATASKDYTCPTSNPSIVSYTIPDTLPVYVAGTMPASNLTLPSGDTYEPVTWSNNYKTTDSTTTLNSASALAIAAGGKSGCNGVAAPGGEGTYYAQVIYAAQAALTTQQNANAGTQNAMIILTDGDATACASNANTSAGACNSNSQIAATEGTLNGTGTHTSNPTGYENYTYPSALGECGQAVLAAQVAANEGTKVYTIGYGAETSGGCTTDQTYSATVTTNGGSWSPGKQPCQAIAAMASAPVNFYSDDGSGCQATAPTNQSITQLTAIFRAITDRMSTPRLIPNGTT